jgi:polyhydroxyalkanoate synthesis regulator phasin
VANPTTEAQQQAEEAATTAVEKGKEAGRSAREASGELVGEARDQVGDVTTEIKGQARQLLDDTRSQIRSQADSQKALLADALGTLGRELQALVNGQPDQAGNTGRYVEQAGNAVGNLAAQVRDRNVAGIVDDVQRFARRRPAVYLAAMAAAGFVAGRLARSTSDDRDRASTPGGGQADGP